MQKKEGRWEMAMFSETGKTVLIRKFRTPTIDGKHITVLAPGLVEAKMLLAAVGSMLGWVTSHEQVPNLEQVEFSEQSSRG